MNEFELIRRYFHFSAGQAAETMAGAVDLGVGDDCALLSLPPGEQLAVTTDTLVSGVHFTADGNPSLIARRALRVNLSDLAAMGAEPLGFQLALTLPNLDTVWLAAFSAGLAEDARQFNCPLIGGDTTKGPLAITITLLGSVPKGQALTRAGASVGDLLFVTGTLGDSAAGLACLQAGKDDGFLLQRYWLPEPRLTAGHCLRGLATAALDISDGLLQDIAHIARASGLSARIHANQLPLSTALRQSASREQSQAWALCGGDDYELCFTLAPKNRAEMLARLGRLGIAASCIGEMVPAGLTPVDCLDDDGKPIALAQGGYDHFAP